jgi:hypothetical protein
MSDEPPDASKITPELSGCEVYVSPGTFGSFATDSFSLSKSYAALSAASTGTFEQALRDNPFVFAMQQESLHLLVRHTLSAYSVTGPPFPGQFEPPLSDEELEPVKEMMATVSKQPDVKACTAGIPVMWGEGDATAVG